jgi:hypothetical protein
MVIPYSLNNIIRSVGGAVEANADTAHFILHIKKEIKSYGK